LRGGHHPPWVVRVRHLGRIVLAAGARGTSARGWIARGAARVTLRGRLVRWDEDV